MSLLNLLFPKTCLDCGRGGKNICEDCLKKVRTPKSICPECLKPAIDGMTHSKCARPQGLDGLISLWEYDGVIRRAILALKYKFALEVARELSEKAVQSIQTHDSLFVIRNSFTLVPIPLYWYKKNFRGFNQVEEIGRLISENLGWKFIPDLIIKPVSTSPQTELKRKARLIHVRGVFSLNPKYQSLAINHRPLVLFDDVWTTGSTLKEAAKVLKRVGVEKVWGLTLARGKN